MPTSKGTYNWFAVYSGDANYNQASPPQISPTPLNPLGLGLEPDSVTPPTPTLPTNTDVQLNTGIALNDTATLAANYNPTGTIVFYLFAPGVTPRRTYSNNVYSDTVTVNGNGLYSTGGGHEAGWFRAHLRGELRLVGGVQRRCQQPHDSAPRHAREPTAIEPNPVSPAGPTISTTTAGTSTGLPSVLGDGSNLTDTATLAGGYKPTGTITFYLYKPGTSPGNGSPVYSDTVTVNGNGSYSTATGKSTGNNVPKTTGSYEWYVVYSGDSNNSPAKSGLGSEPDTVNPASPSITTKPGEAVTVGSGKTLSDSATLSGGYNPTGTIIFYLYRRESPRMGRTSMASTTLPSTPIQSRLTATGRIAQARQQEATCPCPRALTPGWPCTMVMATTTSS